MPVLSFAERKRLRKSFGRLRDDLPIPHLIEVQRKSYEDISCSMAVKADKG